MPPANSSDNHGRHRDVGLSVLGRIGEYVVCPIIGRDDGREKYTFIDGLLAVNTGAAAVEPRAMKVPLAPVASIETRSSDAATT